MITALYVMSYWEGKRSTDDRKNVPYSVFMTPPCPVVGMTEEQARESGADIQVVTLPVAAIPRARVMNDTRGVLKAIVDNKTQRILGASLLCVDSHEMINIVKMVMDAGLPYSILRDQIFTHPSMSESPMIYFISQINSKSDARTNILASREKNLINSLLLCNS